MRARVYIFGTEEEDNIILGVDEIVDIRVKTGSFSRTNANVPSETMVEIQGKIFSEVEDSMINDFVENIKALIAGEFKSPWDKDKKNEISQRTKNIIRNKYQNVNFDDNLHENIYKINQENFINLKKWTASFYNTGDYRDVIIEYIYSYGGSFLYVLPKLYVVDLDEYFSIEQGNSNFTLKLRQKIAKEEENEFLT